MSERSDEEIERVLIEELRSKRLSDESLARIRVAVECEWTSATAADPGRRRFRHWRWASVAAAVSIAVLATAWFWSASPSGAPLGSITRLNGNASEVRTGLFGHHPLQTGEVLRPGESLAMRGSALIALHGAGTLSMAADSLVDIIGPNEIRLNAGKIYVDKPAAAVTPDRLLVDTTVGTIEHVGTAFEVVDDRRTVRVRVREGRVHLYGKSADVVADAGTELISTPGGEISRHPITTYGPDWQWVAALAADYAVEGQSLLSFLVRVSRDVGRSLEFSSPEVRKLAARTIMHGSVHGQEPLDALANVLATTSLSYVMRGDTIWVQSAQ